MRPNIEEANGGREEEKAKNQQGGNSTGKEG